MTDHDEKARECARRVYDQDPRPCVCGHAREEHGRDPAYPASTACCECDCIAFEMEDS